MSGKTKEMRDSPMEKLRVAGIVRESFVDGPGIRYTIFVQGCPHHCPGCHNPETHDFAGGTERDPEVLLREIGADPLLSGVTFSGGEPFCQAGPLAALAREVRALGLDVLVYSGYTYERLLEGAAEHPEWTELLGLSDFLIDGPFILAERDLELQFRGSRNQRIIDLRRSREAGQAVVLERL